MLKHFCTKRGLAKALFFRTFAKKTFLLPDLGEKIKDGEIKKLHVKEGSIVKEYDPIAEVATDKATAEITSPFNGKILKFFHKENEICNVGEPFFEIDVLSEEKAEEIQKEHQSKTQAKEADDRNLKPSQKSTDKSSELPAQEEVASSQEEEGARREGEIRTTLSKSTVLSTPAVRAFAKAMGVDVSKIKPSGKNNRVLKEDVIDYLEQFERRNSQIKNEGTISKLNSLANEKTLAEMQKIDAQKSTTIKMNAFERGMAKSMTYAASVPHFNLNEEYVIEELADMRDKLKRRGVNISLFALIAKAFSLALHESPKMNSTYLPESDQFAYQLNDAHNISIAIDSKFGLVAPNIKNVEGLSAEDIDREVKKLRDLSNEQKLTNEHLSGGTIGLSNVGTIAGHYATPLNLPGQTCIVALGKVQYKPVYDENSGEFVAKRTLPVSFGCDHRVLDGATVARFSVLWKNYIENPYLILAKLK